MTERDAPSADVVKLVDDALLARAVFEQRRPTEALHKAQHTARAAVLDAFAAQKTEIERLKAAAVEAEQVTQAWRDQAAEWERRAREEHAEIERLERIVAARDAQLTAEIELSSKFSKQVLERETELRRLKAARASPPKYEPYQSGWDALDRDYGTAPEQATAQTSPSIAQAVRDIRAQQASPGDALREALTDLLDYASQLEMVAYDRQAFGEHKAITKAKAALNQTGEA